MTRRYIAGERARFISPVALYLFTVFAMFGVLNLTGELASTGTHFKEGLKSEITSDQAKLAKLQAQRAKAAAAGVDLTALDKRIASRMEDISANQKMLSGQSPVQADVDVDTPDWVRPFVRNVRENPQLVSMKVQDAASKYSWLLIPLSVPFMWLLFPFRRKYNTYDHTVFVTYSLSFMMMLVIVGGLAIAAGLSSIAGLLFFVPPFHMYRHLKQSYELGRFSAIVRTMALVTFAFIAIALFAAATVAIGAM
jgi:hypothetical protein